jgi:putative spermidine/putrescine transport system permease protein
MVAPHPLVAEQARKPSFRASLAPLAGLAPLVALVVLFLALPVATVIYGSLQTSSGHLGLANFAVSFTSIYVNSWATTLGVSAASAATGAAFGLLVAWQLYRGAGARLREATIAAASVGANFAGLPLALAFMVSLSPGGLVSDWLQTALHVSLAQSGFSLVNPSGLVLVYAFFQVPLMVVLISPALASVAGQDWLAAADSLGAGRIETFVRVVMPVILPAVLGAFLLLLANAFGAYVTAYAIGGGTVNLLPIQIGYLINGNIQLQPGLADALALEMLLCMGVLLLLYRRLTAGRGRVGV